MNDRPMADAAPSTAAVEDDLRLLEAEAEALRAAGREEEAARLMAWRALHALRAGKAEA